MTQPAKRLPGALLWEKASVFAMGGTAYLAAELVWRGATHWTMFFAGGGCFCLLVWLEHCPNLTLPSAAALGRWASLCWNWPWGQLCLVALRVRVWDYRAEWGNIAALSVRAIRFCGIFYACGCCSACEKYAQHRTPYRCLPQNIKRPLKGLRYRGMPPEVPNNTLLLCYTESTIQSQAAFTLQRKGGLPHVCSVSQCLRPYRSLQCLRPIPLFCRYHGGSLAGAGGLTPFPASLHKNTLTTCLFREKRVCC